MIPSRMLPCTCASAFCTFALGFWDSCPKLVWTIWPPLSGDGCQ